MVTFVIPYYRGRTLIDAAIASVLCQTDDRWRLIVVDDGSNDGQAEYLQSYMSDRVSVFIHGVNRGLYFRLGEVIAEHVETEWVTILMQDDRLKPDYVAFAMEVAEAKPHVNAMWFEYDTIDASGQVVRPGIDSGRHVLLTSENSWYDTLATGCMWSVYGSFTRASLFKRHPFRSDLPHCGDYEWFLRTLDSEDILYVESARLYMMSHEGQASAGNLWKGIDLREELFIMNRLVPEFKPDVRRGRLYLRKVEIAVKATRRAARSFIQGAPDRVAMFLGIALRALRP